MRTVFSILDIVVLLGLHGCILFTDYSIELSSDIQALICLVAYGLGKYMGKKGINL